MIFGKSGNAQRRGHQALGSHVIASQLRRARRVKEKSGFPLQIAGAVRAGYEGLLRLRVFLVAEVGAADREPQLIVLLWKGTNWKRQQRDSSRRR